MNSVNKFVSQFSCQNELKIERGREQASEAIVFNGYLDVPRTNVIIWCEIGEKNSSEIS